jgi:hypothetical protein
MKEPGNFRQILRIKKINTSQSLSTFQIILPGYELEE